MIIEKIKPMVIKLCGDPEHRWWRLHIESVVKYSKLFAKKMNADEEILEVSAWLHDIQKIKGNRKLHHVNGAKEAEKILMKFGYPEDKIKQVKHCILTHSSDKNYPPESKEAIILHNADSLSHFDNSMPFAHWVYGLDKLSIENGRNVLIDKYKRDWNKLTLPEARKIAKPKYDAIKIVLKK
ncbi:MAG: HD domain-containing protein [Candidatus Aenigmarchaeota archaeon]|nr:HD domain-containing protein [Candidatus Aenigmarchaeota archaeon]